MKKESGKARGFGHQASEAALVAGSAMPAVVSSFQEKRNRRTFIRILAVVTLCVLVIILVMSAMLQRLLRDILKKQSLQLSSNRFVAIQTETEAMGELATTITTELILDDASSVLLSATKAGSINSIQIYQAARQMNRYHLMLDQVISVHIYNRSLQQVFTTEGKGIYSLAGFHDQGLQALMDRISSGKARFPIRRQAVVLADNPMPLERDVFTYVAPFMYRGGEVPSAVIVNISADWLKARILSAPQSADQYIDIRNERGSLMTLNGLTGLPIRELEAAVSQFRESGKEDAELSVGNQRYYLSHLHSARLNWDFYAVNRWEDVFGALLELRRIFGAVLLTVLLISAVLTLFASGFLYRTYWALSAEIARLTGRHPAAADAQRVFWREHLFGVRTSSPQELQEKLRGLGMESAEGERFDLITLLTFPGQGGERTAGQTIADLFSASLGGPSACAQLFQLEGYHVFVRRGLQDAQELPSPEEGFQQFLLKAHTAFPERFNLLTMDEPAPLMQLQDLWQQQFRAMNLAFFYPHEAVLNVEQMEEEHGRIISQRQLKHSVLEALRSADAPGAQAQYHQLAEQIEGCGYEDYLGVMTWLGITVNNLVSEFLHYIPAGEGEEPFPDAFFVHLRSFRKRSELDDYFLKILAQAADIIARANLKSGALGKIADVRAYIEREYADPNLNLDQLADRFALSGDHLRKTFRAAMGVSLADYLNQVRLAQVLKLLEHSDDTVQKIAQDCGFLGNSYFYTFFKKKTGMTPRAYLEKTRK